MFLMLSNKGEKNLSIPRKLHWLLTGPESFWDNSSFLPHTCATSTITGTHWLCPCFLAFRHSMYVKALKALFCRSQVPVLYGPGAALRGEDEAGRKRPTHHREWGRVLAEPDHRRLQHGVSCLVLYSYQRRMKTSVDLEFWSIVTRLRRPTLEASDSIVARRLLRESTLVL